MPIIRQLLLSSIFVLIAFAATCQAGSAADIQNRMRDRLPAITVLKEQGIVGENNAGFLQFIGKPQQSSLIEDENSDRRLVYQAIARKQGVNAKLVGKRRAISLAEKSSTGYFQDNSGKWYQK